MRKIIAYLLVFIMVFSPSASFSQNAVAGSAESNSREDPVKAVLDLETLVQEALAKNPEIIEFKRKADAYKARIPQASSLDDPRFGYAAVNIPVDDPGFDNTPMSGNQLSLKQKVPYPHKLILQRKIARHESEAIDEVYQEKVNQITREVKEAYYDLYYIEKALYITRKNKEVLEGFVKIAETKYSVGTGRQQDVLLAQVEVSRLLDKILILEQERQKAIATLNTLRDQLPQASLDGTPDIVKESLNFDFEGLSQIALELNPDLKAARHDVEQFESAVRLAKLGYVPDFDFGLDYRIREFVPGDPVAGSDFFGGSITINLPVYAFSKQSQRVAEAKAKAQSSEARYQALVNDIEKRVYDLFTLLNRQDKQIFLIKDGIIPQAHQSLESAIAGYKVNKVDFLTLLSNQVTLFNYEEDYHRLLSDHEKTVARLEYVVGKTF